MSLSSIQALILSGAPTSQVSLVGGKITQTRAGVRGIYVGVSVGGESVGLCREL